MSAASNGSYFFILLDSTTYPQLHSHSNILSMCMMDNPVHPSNSSPSTVPFKSRNKEAVCAVYMGHQKQHAGRQLLYHAFCPSLSFSISFRRRSQRLLFFGPRQGSITPSLPSSLPRSRTKFLQKPTRHLLILLLEQGARRIHEPSP